MYLRSIRLNRRKMSNQHDISSSQTTSETATASTGVPDCRSDRPYDVFLNFRGPDSRYTVADVLYHALINSGFRVFLDDEEIRKGEVIEGELLGAITNSRIYIPIFSKDYASSKWCLRELAKMIDCWETSRSDAKKVILPIFFDVDVSEDVKLRSQVYTNALKKHNGRLGVAVVKPWEDALRKVATIKGWNLKDHGLNELADLIKAEVFRTLTASEALPNVPDRLVGIDKPIEDIMRLLEEGSSAVRFIVIHGMGGIGKTTLANAVFNKVSSRFQGSCFLKDVRRSASDHDMMKLQEKLLLGTLNLKFIKVSDIDAGIHMISKRLRNQSVLIVLDDVDKRDHLLNLAAKSFWFGPKSRIIITTRNTEFFPTKDDKEHCFYEMEEMNHGHALQLFCRHAFEKDRPPPKFYDISTEIVAATGRLPLALQVVGSSLYNQDNGTWKFRLEKLKEAPHKDVQQTLMISYEALEYEQQQIFLDIACFFNDEMKIYPIYFWKACKFFPESVIEILVRRSLIKVDDRDTLWMHDQLRDLGRAIAQPKLQGHESQTPAKSSRLWYPERALGALQKKEVDEGIVALNLRTPDADCCFVPEDFARAVNLKFLQLQGGDFAGDFKNVLQQLRWLSWSGCPLRFGATNIVLKNLVILKLTRSQIAKDWGGWSLFAEAKHLKVLHLEDCKCLKETPEFSTFLGLERLVLRDCLELEVIDRSISKLKHLNYLEISNDNIFRRIRLEMPARPQLLQDCLGDLKALEVLRIEDVGLQELHPSIGELAHLKVLCLKCPLLRNLPDSIGKLTSLVELDLCYLKVKELPESIGEFKQLNILRMDGSEIEYLPDTIGGLESLEQLFLASTKITRLPETIGYLKRLKVIFMSWSKIKMLPEALVKLENLERLEASGCWQMDGNLPMEIGKLSRLRTLNLGGTTMISRVPVSISQLSHLQDLNLRVIDAFPWKLPMSLISLTIIFHSRELHAIPDLSYMTNLVTLELSNVTDSSHWTSAPRIQAPCMKWLARLQKLEKLVLILPDLISPPTELRFLSCLRWLEIRCFGRKSLTHLPSGLETLGLYDVESPIDWQILSGWYNLSTLALEQCRLKEVKVDCLGHLRVLRMNFCKFLERLSNLSSLKELQVLEIDHCKFLVDVEGLGELKSLQSLNLTGCTSIRRLPDLSRLKMLEELIFNYCLTLEAIPHMDKQSPCRLVVVDCDHFHNFEGPYSEHHRAIKT